MSAPEISSIESVQWTRPGDNVRRDLDVLTIAGKRVLRREYHSVEDLLAQSAHRGVLVGSHEDTVAVLAGNASDHRSRWALGVERGEAIPAIGDVARDIAEGRSTALALAAYQTMRDEMSADIERTVDAAPSTRRRRVLACEGDDVHVDRYLRGDEKCLWARKRGRRKALVRLAVNLGISCGNDASTFARVAAGAAAGAEVLERLGYAVEIDAVIALTCDSGSGWYVPQRKPVTAAGVVLRWPVKRSDERCDPERLLSLSHVGLLRAFGFGALCFDMPIQSGNGSLGHCQMPDYMHAAVGADALCGASWESTGADGRIVQTDIWKGIQRAASGARDRHGV